MQMKQILFLSTFLIALMPLSAQDNQIIYYSSSITEAELQEHVKILASDDFMGRETGFEGQKKAARYIHDNFKMLNLTGPADGNNPFFQEFELFENDWDKFILVKNADSMFIGKELYVSGRWPEGEQILHIVFVGHGADTEHYSDYKGIDVEGKVVAFINGEPLDKNGRFLTTGSFVPEYSIVGYDKARIAKNKGAVGAIMIDPDQSKIDKMIAMKKKFSNSQQLFLPSSGKFDNYDNGMIAMGYENASLLFGNSIKDWEKYLKKMSQGKSVSGILGTDIKLVSEKGTNKISSENVLGMIRGSELPNEYIIIIAHYDHLGQRDDVIFNGADDNASGTAAVIEIAEAFAEAAEAGYPPKRSILFMPVSGEEKGLLGSRFYTSNPTVPLQNTIAALNMDMIGRQDGYAQKDTAYVFLYLSDEPGSNLDKVVKNASKLEGQDFMTIYKYKESNELSLRGSDHASFENEGVPVLYFYCGTHVDYHRPTDTWEKLDYHNLTNIARMVFASAWQLANQN